MAEGIRGIDHGTAGKVGGGRRSYAHAGGQQSTSRMTPDNSAALEAFLAAPPGHSVAAVEAVLAKSSVRLVRRPAKPAGRETTGLRAFNGGRRP